MAQKTGELTRTGVLRDRPTTVKQILPSMQHPLETMRDGEPMQLSQSATPMLVRTCLIFGVASHPRNP